MRRDGSRFWGQLLGAPVSRNDAGAGTIWTLGDVSEERRKRNALSWAATHDALTNIANRQEFESRLAEHLDDRRRREVACVLYVDLDGFKAVNDAAGHAAGDQLLRDIAALLLARIRSIDLAARLGGDEFAVLLQACALPTALNVAEQIRARVDAHSLVWQGAPLPRRRQHRRRPDRRRLRRRRQRHRRRRRRLLRRQARRPQPRAQRRAGPAPGPRRQAVGARAAAGSDGEPAGRSGGPTRAHPRRRSCRGVRRAPRRRCCRCAPAHGTRGRRRRTSPASRARRGASASAVTRPTSARSSRCPGRTASGSATRVEVIAALVARPAGRVQREAEEDEAGDAGQRRLGLRLRRHPAAERLAAGEQRQARPGAGSPSATAARTAAWATRGGSGRRERALHRRELEAQRGDAALGQAVGDRGHERMVHAGAGAVREDERRLARRRASSAAPRRRRGRDLDREGFGRRAGHVRPGAGP